MGEDAGRTHGQPVLPAVPVLEVRRGSKRFPGVLALDSVDFQLLPGEVHALVGENGAGKSTLIKVLTGAYQPDGGEVLLRGEPVTFGSPRDAQAAGVSTIYQEVNLVPLTSVARNVFLGREPRRYGLVDVKETNRAAAEILGRYGIHVDVTAPLRSLALGVQQMVAVVRAISVDARVVVMDEPTSSLEAREVDTLFGVIDLLRTAGVAVLYVSHRLDELWRICDRVTVLRDGRHVHTGPLAEQTRLSLISLMLGRDLAEVRRDGTTAFTTDRDTTERDTTDEGQVTHDGGTAGDRPGPEPVLAAAGLTRSHLLDDVSLQVRPGEVVGIGGLLGAGRSETLKAIVGAQPLDSGTVTVAGHRIRRGSTAAAIRAGVALLPEDRKSEGIVPGLSIRDNIALAALPRLSRWGFVSDRKVDEVVRTFMDRLRIKASGPDQLLGELSGGNQQKVLLARWLCLHPKVLLLDEPTRGIDVGAKAEVQSLVDDLARAGLGVVLVSSELEEVVEGSDTVVVLREGAVVDVLRGERVSEDNLLAALAGGHD